MDDLMLSTEQIFQGYQPIEDMKKVEVTPLLNDNLNVVMSNSYGNRPLTSELYGDLSGCLTAYNWEYLSSVGNPPYDERFDALKQASAEYRTEPSTDNILCVNNLGPNENDKWYEYIRADISSNVYKGEFDPNGVYFPCDTKIEIDTIDQYITVGGSDSN